MIKQYYEDKHIIMTEILSGMSARLSGLFWIFFLLDVFAMSDSVIHHTYLKFIPIPFILGYLVSTLFSGAETNYEKGWALALGTVLLPGFLVVNIVLHIFWMMMFFAKKIFKAHLFVTKLPEKVKTYKANKAKEDNAKLLKAASKVRVKGSGAYRSSPSICKECDRELPELESEYEPKSITSHY